MGEKNLDSLFNLFSFGALVEIGDHTEASAVVLDESDGGSPSSESFNGRILRFEFEILQQLLHWLIGQSLGIEEPNIKQIELGDFESVRLERPTWESEAETAEILNNRGGGSRTHRESMLGSKTKGEDSAVRTNVRLRVIYKRAVYDGFVK